MKTENSCHSDKQSDRWGQYIQNTTMMKQTNYCSNTLTWIDNEKCCIIPYLSPLENTNTFDFTSSVVSSFDFFATNRSK